MLQTIEAIVDEQGAIHLAKPVGNTKRVRAILTIYDALPYDSGDTALMSESSLAVDWDREEEDVAWSYLQSAR